MKKWIIINKDEPIKYDLIDVYNNKINGFVIKNFLNNEILKKIKPRLLNSENPIQTDSPYAKIIGKKMESKSGNFQELPLNKYLEYSSIFRESIKAELSFDLENEFISYFEKLTNLKVSVPFHKDKSYTPFTVRILKNKMGIQTHVGNEFINKMEETKNLGLIANTYNQLSYFCLVQNPEIGGNLVVFDKTWEETSSQNLSNKEAVELVENSYPGVVNLNEGDLLIFAGGQNWHKVTETLGENLRITIGGFIAPSKDDKFWYIWS